MTDGDDSEELTLSIKWSGQDYEIIMSPEETVAVLKRRLGGELPSKFDLQACSSAKLILMLLEADT